MQINRITITGADDQTPVSDLVKFSEKYPIVEWGILHMESYEGKKSRYPSNEWIASFLDEIPDHINCAVHLCRNSVTALKKKRGTIIEMCHKFDRVQLNFNATRMGGPYVIDLAKVVDEEDLVVITQQNQSNKYNILFFGQKHPGDHHLLYDTSGGRGIIPNMYYRPSKLHYSGYAGGLTPDNLETELKRINLVVPPQETVWIDMETGVRTNEKLDMEKVERVVKLVERRCWT